MRVSEHEASRVWATADSAARTSRGTEDRNAFVLDVPSAEARDLLLRVVIDLMRSAERPRGRAPGGK
jgi:hypothetical protein